MTPGGGLATETADKAGGGAIPAASVIDYPNQEGVALRKDQNGKLMGL